MKNLTCAFGDTNAVDTLNITFYRRYDLSAKIKYHFRTTLGVTLGTCGIHQTHFGHCPNLNHSSRGHVWLKRPSSSSFPPLSLFLADIPDWCVLNLLKISLVTGTALSQGSPHLLVTACFSLAVAQLTLTGKDSTSLHTWKLVSLMAVLRYLACYHICPHPPVVHPE